MDITLREGERWFEIILYNILLNIFLDASYLFTLLFYCPHMYHIILGMLPYPDGTVCPSWSPSTGGEGLPPDD